MTSRPVEFSQDDMEMMIQSTPSQSALADDLEAIDSIMHREITYIQREVLGEVWAMQQDEEHMLEVTLKKNPQLKRPQAMEAVASHLEHVERRMRKELKEKIFASKFKAAGMRSATTNYHSFEEIHGQLGTNINAPR